MTYGIGIAVTTLVVLAGLYCIWTSAHSTGANFSAILRTTRNPRLDAIVPAKDTVDTAIMSKELGKTTLVFKREIERGQKRAFFTVYGEEDTVEGDVAEGKSDETSVLKKEPLVATSPGGK